MSNRLVVCPYDEAHKVKESRIQLHITKCRMNYLNTGPQFVCPFNARHVLPKQEESYHLSLCPDKAVMVRMMAAPADQNNPCKGRTAVPSYSDPIPADTDEVWDVEEFDEGYQPVMDVPLGTILHPEPLAKPSTRKQLYRDMYQLPSELDKRSESPTVPPPAPRQPKQNCQAAHDTGVENVGLARGKPPTTRIAANIFSQQPKVNNTAPAQPNYSAVISGMKNLNVGRGVANGASANPPFLNNDDFPALGVGRGVAKNPQIKEMKAPGSRW